MKKSKKEWIIFEWPGYHIYQSIAPMKAWYNDFTPYGLQVSKMAVAYSRGTTIWYFLKNEYESLGAKLFEQVKQRPEIMFRVLREVDKAANKIFEIGKKWQNTNFTLLPDKALIANHQLLFKWDEVLWRRGQIQNLLEFHNSYLTDYVRQFVTAEDFYILTTSRYVTAVKRQDEDFLKLYEKLKKLELNSLKLQQILRQHWQRYTWMIYSWAGPALGEDYFTENLLTTRKNPKILSKIVVDREERLKAWRKQDKLLRSLPKQDRRLVVLLRKLLESKARRVDAHSLTYYLGDKILAEVGRRVGLSINQMRVVPPAEVARLFRKVDVDRINQEYEFVLYWFEKQKYLVKLVGKKAHLKMKPILAAIPKLKATNIVRGEPAFPGKVKGHVKIILNAKDIPRFKKNEVLVTRVTDPGYVPIIKIAKAIVTDIGGITSHAAIVSRELKIPCVIGTKIATKVFKTGDLVEVDAEKGIVRRISR